MNPSELDFDRIYDLYWEDLFYYVVKILDNEDDAQDVIQEVFTSYWNILEKAPDIRSHKAYLLTIARNQALKHILKSKNYQQHIDRLTAQMDVYESSLDQNYMAQELSSIIDLEVSSLPPKMQTVFNLSRKEELSYQEIAERLDITDHTVKKQISRALKSLRIKLKEFLPDQ